MAARFDVIVVGAGHNGLVAATILARTGRRVLVLERAGWAGGAAASASPFAGVDARVSRYAYLLSLFPRWLLSELGVHVELRPRAISSYTPHGDAGVLVCEDARRTHESIVRTVGVDGTAEALHRFQRMIARVAAPVFDSLTAPLPTRAGLERLIADERAWRALFERPLSELLESMLPSDLVRGTVATDALIGTFTALDDEQLRQNRCFLYHVIGNGSGRWEVPVGGMGALAAALYDAASNAGADVRLGVPVARLRAQRGRVEVVTGQGGAYAARHLLANVAPSVLAGLLGDPPPRPAPEGSQLKVNLLLARLPRVRDEAVSSAEAFAGTFHVNEGYRQLNRAYGEAAAGRIPALPPCEAYCHSLTDATILGSELRAAGAHALTVFVLHMPARLFRRAHARAKREAVAATLRSLDSALAEPLEGCLLRSADGEPCLEARTPLELEAELALPGGHIFHRDLAWPFAQCEREAGRWGVETARPNVWLCGAGARRGGGVSGIPGHNAARAVIAADAGRC